MKKQVHKVVGATTDHNILEALLTSGYDVNYEINDKRSICVSMLEKEDVELSTLCLNNGEDILQTQYEDVMNKIVKTEKKDLLELCLSSKNDRENLLPFVNRLPRNKLDEYYVRIRSSNKTWPAKNEKQCMEIVKILIAHGANIKAINSNSLIMVCAEASKYKNTLRFVKFLVSCGADINGVTVNTGPLHAAINSGSL